MILTNGWLDELAATHPHFKQSDWCEMLGVAKSNWTNWRKGDHAFSEDVALKVADVLHVPRPAVLATSLYERTQNPDLRSIYENLQRAAFAGNVARNSKRLQDLYKRLNKST